VNHTIRLDFTTIGPGSVWRETQSGVHEPAVDSWSNPEYRFDPVIGIQLVLRDRKGRVRENRFVTATVADPEVLRSYYGRVHASHGYTPAEPFLFELHAAMLKRLDAIFQARIPQGSRVLDAGCGRSLFTEIRARWPFMIVAATWTTTCCTSGGRSSRTCTGRSRPLIRSRSGTARSTPCSPGS
jgi:hypothetical protein